MDEEGEIEMDEPPPGYVPEDPEAENDDVKDKDDEKVEASDANEKLDSGTIKNDDAGEIEEKS